MPTLILKVDCEEKPENIREIEDLIQDSLFEVNASYTLFEMDYTSESLFDMDTYASKFCCMSA